MPQWIVENWQTIVNLLSYFVNGASYAIAGASVIVRLSPNRVQNRILDKILRFFRKLALSPSVSSLKTTITVAEGYCEGSADLRLNMRQADVYFGIPELDSTDTAELIMTGPNKEQLMASGHMPHGDGEIVTYSILNVSRLPGDIKLTVRCSSKQSAERRFTVVINGE